MCCYVGLYSGRGAVSRVRRRDPPRLQLLRRRDPNEPHHEPVVPVLVPSRDLPDAVRRADDDSAPDHHQEGGGASARRRAARDFLALRLRFVVAGLNDVGPTPSGSRDANEREYESVRRAPGVTRRYNLNKLVTQDILQRQCLRDEQRRVLPRDDLRLHARDRGLHVRVEESVAEDERRPSG